MPESFSSIQDFQRCPEKYRRRHIERIEPVRKNENFFWGSEAHGFFQTFALAIQDGNTVAEAIMAVDNHAAVRCQEAELSPLLFSDEQADAVNMIEEAHAMVRRYLDKHWDEDWEVLHVEEQFTYSLSADHVVTFTPDLVVRDHNGYVWVIDWKTTKNSVPDVPDVPFEDLQALLYSSGVKQLYPELKGFIFVRLRKKTPTQPRLNKTRDKASGLYFVNNLKSIDTTYEILRTFIEERAPELMQHPAHALRLAELRENDRFHWVELVLVTDTMIEKANAEVRATLDYMDFANNEGTYYRVHSAANFGGCSSCPYQRLCRSEVLGWNTQAIIEDEYQDRDMSYKEYDEEEPF